MTDLPAITKLKSSDTWVAWNYVTKKNRAKPTKVPIDPHTGRFGAVNKSHTWSSFEKAAARAKRDHLPGIGYVLTEHDGLTGADLDNVRDPATGKLEPWAAEIIALAETYAEISPSGTGIRLFCEGKIDEAIARSDIGVEVYGDGRYLTVTCNHVADTPTQILPAPKTLAALRRRATSLKKPNDKGGNEHTEHEDISDDIRAAKGAGRGLGDGDEPPTKYDKINSEALNNLDKWVPALFHDTPFTVTADGVYRIASEALGRDLEEDLSISPKGIRDFGLEIGMSALDVVIKYSDTCKNVADDKKLEAAFISLSKRLGHEVKEPNSHTIPLQWHGDALPAPQRWLIRNRLPETGAGLLVGQWGMLKTFMALDLSAHVMMGWDWTGEPVYRKAGVLCLAQEGSGSIPMRLAALVEHKIEPTEGRKKLPFAWAGSCPMLLGKDKDDPLPMLLATAEQVNERFIKDFGLPLGLIWIDTLSSAGGWSDENDNAEAAQLMNVLRNFSDRSGAVVVGVDHLGKNVEAGSRGASAKEANSDFVLALLGTKNLAGDIADMRLALRKMREGPSGLEIPVAPRSVDMGQDEHGYPLTSVVLNWDVKRESTTRKSKAYRVLEHALAVALREHGATVKTAKGIEVRAVDRDQVLAAYKAAYKPGEKVNDGAKRERFRKALAGAGARIVSETIGGVDYLWSVECPPLSGATRHNETQLVA